MSDWDRFIEHDPELDKRASELITDLVYINRFCEEHPLLAASFCLKKRDKLSELRQIQIKRGVMKGPEDK